MSIYAKGSVLHSVWLWTQKHRGVITEKRCWRQFMHKKWIRSSLARNIELSWCSPDVNPWDRFGRRDWNWTRKHSASFTEQSFVMLYYVNVKEKVFSTEQVKWSIVLLLNTGADVHLCDLQLEGVLYTQHVKMHTVASCSFFFFFF